MRLLVFGENWVGLETRWISISYWFKNHFFGYNSNLLAGVVELVDTLDLGSSVVRRESSSLSFRTIKTLLRALMSSFHNIPNYIKPLGSDLIQRYRYPVKSHPLITFSLFFLQKLIYAN